MIMEHLLEIASIGLFAISIPLARLAGQYLKSRIELIENQTMKHVAYTTVALTDKVLRDNASVEKYDYAYKKMVAKFPQADSLQVRGLIEEAYSTFISTVGKKGDSVQISS